jgi:hypothetical protein
MAATNKRLLISESRGDSNRCTPCREKPNQHDTYTSHTSPRTPNIRFLRSILVHGNLSRVINKVGRMHWSWEKVLPTPPLSPIEWSMGPAPVYLPTQPLKQSLKPSTCRQQTTRLTGPISPACDRYVHYFLTCTNPSVLNWHRRGLPHRKPQNSHSTLPTLLFWGFHWSL